LKVEEKFTKFSGEPRDARKKCGTQPIFGQILSKVVIKTQNRALPNFQILVVKSKLKNSVLESEIKIIDLKSKILIPLESRFETSKFEFSALDLVRI